jgi:uncharacterized protein (UPF0333 family)
MRLAKSRKGMASEVFKLALAIIVVAAVLAIFAVFFSTVRESGGSSLNATMGALENLSAEIANRTAFF